MASNPAIRGAQSDLVQTASAGVIAALIIAALYFGRPLLVPFALAVLLAFVLAPPTEYLRGFGLPRTFSAIATVLTSVVVLGALGAFIVMQAGRLASDLPHYQTNLTTKIESVRGAAAGNTIVESASALFKGLNAAFVGKRNTVPQALPTATGPSPRVQRPIPVEITRPELEPVEVIEGVIGPLLEPLATLAIAIVFVVFMLLQKEDLRNRFISLAGTRDLQRTSMAIDDGAQRLSRYLLLQTTVNACVGAIIMAGLWLIGVPTPALWGLIAAVFRFVPYVGIPAAAAIPLALALAVDPGWTMVILTAALYLSTEAITGQGVEPWLYGRHMGLSPIAVVLSAAFWTWVWGPVGLLLAIPLTMCVVVLGRHVEGLHFLDVLLGNQPALSSEEQFYLRMLTGNPDEAAEHAEHYLKDKTIVEYFDDVAIKGLVLAQRDINRGVLSEEAHDKILAAVAGLMENLAIEGMTESRALLPASWQDQPVLCVAGRGPLDQAAAALLTTLLAQRGIGAKMISPDDASQTNVLRIDPAGIRAICLSYLEPGNPTNARYLVRRLRKQIPGVPVVAGFWSVTQSDTHFLDWVVETGCDLVASDLASAVERIAKLANTPREELDCAPPPLLAAPAA